MFGGEVVAEARKTVRVCEGGAAAGVVRAGVAARRGRARLRVGYLSADFRVHPVTLFAAAAGASGCVAGGDLLLCVGASPGWDDRAAGGNWRGTGATSAGWMMRRRRG